MNDPLNIMQVLCTRLCHDLAGPIGAVAAGVELVGGDPSQVDAETLGLIASSSSAASRKLKFLRLALGSSGGGALQDFKTTVGGYFEAIAGPSGPAQITWPNDLAPVATAAGGHGTQILANLILAASEVVPRLRDVTVSVTAAGADIRIDVMTKGEISAKLDPRIELTALLANPGAATLSPKTVHALYTAEVVARAGGQLTGEATDGGYRITVIAPLK